VKPIAVGVVGFDGVCALDLVGPMDAFVTVKGKAYELFVIGLTDKAFVADSGLSFNPLVTLESAPPLDTLIVPGGSGSTSPNVARVLVPWLRKREPQIRRVASVCTGAYLLAESGLLDGRTVTTHWASAADLAQRFPQLTVQPDALFLKSGKFYTSAGITAGIDLALALIEEDYGAEAALSVARTLVVYLKRTGGQRQYSDPLQLQVDSHGPFFGLVEWIKSDLTRDLSVDALAAHVALSPAHFSRLFKRTFGVPPADFVDGLRLDQARALLSVPDVSIKSVAAAVGFASPDVFRRSFARRFGLPPSAYRTPFGVQATHPNPHPPR